MSLLEAFFSFQTALKIYHWQTKVYSRHLASDSLYTSFLVFMDKYVELYQGEFGDLKLKNTGTYIPVTNVDDKMIIGIVKGMKQVVSNPKNRPTKDLSNICDDFLGVLNQTLYLFSLS
jgi:hypothetical protein